MTFFFLLMELSSFVLPRTTWILLNHFASSIPVLFSTKAWLIWTPTWFPHSRMHSPSFFPLLTTVFYTYFIYVRVWSLISSPSLLLHSAPPSDHLHVLPPDSNGRLWRKGAPRLSFGLSSPSFLTVSDRPSSSTLFSSSFASYKQFFFHLIKLFFAWHQSLLQKHDWWKFHDHDFDAAWWNPWKM